MHATYNQMLDTETSTVLWRRRKTYPMTKPWKPQCRHGASCVKYGCAFNHPSARRQDCQFGKHCRLDGCTLLHPRPRPLALALASAFPPAGPAGAASSDVSIFTSTSLGENVHDLRSNLKPGTIVLCKRQPSDPVWMSAKLIRISGQTITVKFENSDEVEDMPLSSVRCPPPKTRCRHGVSCVKFGCMFLHPETRRQDCPEGGDCLDDHCLYLHPATSVRLATKSVHIHPATTPPAPIDFPGDVVTTKEAEGALRLLMKAVDSNESFMSVRENRRLLKILGLKAKKTQAVIDEDFLTAYEIKNQIDTLCHTESSNSTLSRGL